MTGQSNIMHCWLMAKVEVGGETYIALRGVNWDGEFDAAHPTSCMNEPRWHVPTVRVLYDSTQPVPSIHAIRDKAILVAGEEWPALALAANQLVRTDQDLTGKWGGFYEPDKPEPVTRLAFDLGVKSELPAVIFKPEQQLFYPRHSIVWVKASQIQKISGTDLAYFVAGNVITSRETNNMGAKENVTASNISLQSTVAEMFELGFGDNLFRPAPPGIVRKPMIIHSENSQR